MTAIDYQELSFTIPESKPGDTVHSMPLLWQFAQKENVAIHYVGRYKDSRHRYTATANPEVLSIMFLTIPGIQRG